MNPDKFSTLSLVQKNLQPQPEMYMWQLSPKDQYFPRHFPVYQCTLNVNMNRNQAFCVALAIFLLQSISIQQQQMVAFFILYMRWINSYQAMLNIAMIWRRNRQLQRQCIAPYAWSKHLLLSMGPFVMCFWFSCFLFSPLCSSTELELDVPGIGVPVLGRLGCVLLPPLGCWLFWGMAGDMLALNTKGSGICCSCMS